MEIWKDIKGYEDKYQVSDTGKIKALNFHNEKKEKELIPKKRRDGYFCIQLYKNNKRKSYYIHKLVAEAFIENPYNLKCINHKDENKQNNNVSNLEFCTIKYNNHYSFKARKNRKKDKKISQYTIDGKLIKQWNTIKEIETIKGYSYYGIFNCLSNRQKTSSDYIWKYEEAI